MSQFESFMAQQFEHYICYRRNRGCSITLLHAQLKKFDCYLVQGSIEPAQLQPALFLHWRSTLTWEPHSTNNLLCTLRKFFDYLIRKGAFRENPLSDIPAQPLRQYLPFVFSEQQTDQLLNAVCSRIKKTEYCYIKDYGVYIAIMLMARCGLRISEPLRLFISHYRPVENTLYIEKTKFKKDRLIPIPQAVATEIDNYLQLRKTLYGDDCSPYLLAGSQKGLSQDQVRRSFHLCVKELDMSTAKTIVANTTFGSPTPHSLRHSFAVNTLLRIKQQGKSPQNALPVLSAYMGHCKYEYTIKYLKVIDADRRQALVSFVMSREGR
jgi:integrase/recombinase XerD